jgi:nucleotide-binding universal stress UspA family protein
MRYSLDVLARPRRYRIVVGIDLTEYSEIVIEYALDQAARHPSPELHFVHVKEQRLTAIVYPCLQTFNEYGTDWRARLHVRRGKPDEQIAQLAADVRGDLVVVGRFGLHHPNQPRKSLATRLVHAAPCPTLVVGMPPAVDSSPRCIRCQAVREDTEGERWFCDDHVAERRAEPCVSPMMTWSGGAVRD